MEDTKTEQRKQVQKEIMSLSTAILAGAVIIGIAVLLGANMVVDRMNEQTTTQFGNSVGGIPTGKSENETIVKVEERKSAPREGSGKIIVQEFSDFQCPFCQKFWSTSYKQIKKNYIDTNKITFIYRHFPLDFHQNAQKAAEAGECAQAQGKFWQYHDLAFTFSKSDGVGLNNTDLKKYAADLGLDTQKFNSCLDNGETTEIVESDLADGQAVGVTGTPTFFINGERLVGALPYADFEKAIEKALK